jgi:hypothetical protein
MKSRGLRIALGVVGLAAVGLGVGHTIADVIESLHASGSSTAESVSLAFSVVWPGAAVVGAVLCAWSYLLFRRRVRS